MRIAFVVHDYRRREGHSRYVVELATRFSRDHEIHVFANEMEPDGGSNIHFHHVPAWRPNALTSILTFALHATLRVRGSFDIIHNQGLCGVRGDVFTAHICSRAWHRALRAAAGHLRFHERVSGNVLSCLEHLFYRFARNRHVICPSNRVVNDIRTLYHSRAPMTVVYHGVDVKTFAPVDHNPVRPAMRARLGIDDREVMFLFVGDMRKGGSQCIHALSQVTAGKLVFISRTPEHEYRSLASRLRVADRVVFAGPTRQVERFYAAADAFLLPTHYDSFAMVLLEAMASALPVVVSREAGAAELIEHGVNGLLLENFRDIQELASYMTLLAENKELARRMGHAARQTAEAHSWDAAAAATMQVYERVLGQRRGMHVPSYSAQS